MSDKKEDGEKGEAPVNPTLQGLEEIGEALEEGARLEDPIKQDERRKARSAKGPTKGFGSGSIEALEFFGLLTDILDENQRDALLGEKKDNRNAKWLRGTGDFHPSKIIFTHINNALNSEESAERITREEAAEKIHWICINRPQTVKQIKILLNESIMEEDTHNIFEAAPSTGPTVALKPADFDPEKHIIFQQAQKDMPRNEILESIGSGKLIPLGLKFGSIEAAAFDRTEFEKVLEGYQERTKYVLIDRDLPPEEVNFKQGKEFSIQTQNEQALEYVINANGASTWPSEDPDKYTIFKQDLNKAQEFKELIFGDEIYLSFLKDQDLLKDRIISINPEKLSKEVEAKKSLKKYETFSREKIREEILREIAKNGSLPSFPSDNQDDPKVSVFHANLVREQIETKEREKNLPEDLAKELKLKRSTPGIEEGSFDTICIDQLPVWLREITEEAISKNQLQTYPSDDPDRPMVFLNDVVAIRSELQKKSIIEGIRKIKAKEQEERDKRKNQPTDVFPAVGTPPKGTTQPPQKNLAPPAQPKSAGKIRSTKVGGEILLSFDDLIKSMQKQNKDLAELLRNKQKANDFELKNLGPNPENLSPYINQKDFKAVQEELAKKKGILSTIQKVVLFAHGFPQETIDRATLYNLEILDGFSKSFEIHPNQSTRTKLSLTGRALEVILNEAQPELLDQQESEPEDLQEYVERAIANQDFEPANIVDEENVKRLYILTQIITKGIAADKDLMRACLKAITNKKVLTRREAEDERFRQRFGLDNIPSRRLDRLREFVNERGVPPDISKYITLKNCGPIGDIILKTQKTNPEQLSDPVYLQQIIQNSGKPDEPIGPTADPDLEQTGSTETTGQELPKGQVHLGGDADPSKTTSTLSTRDILAAVLTNIVNKDLTPEQAEEIEKLASSLPSEEKIYVSIAKAFGYKPDKDTKEQELYVGSAAFMKGLGDLLSKIGDNQTELEAKLNKAVAETTEATKPYQVWVKGLKTELAKKLHAGNFVLSDELEARLARDYVPRKELDQNIDKAVRGAMQRRAEKLDNYAIRLRNARRGGKNG